MSDVQGAAAAAADHGGYPGLAPAHLPAVVLAGTNGHHGGVLGGEEGAGLPGAGEMAAGPQEGRAMDRGSKEVRRGQGEAGRCGEEEFGLWQLLPWSQVPPLSSQPSPSPSTNGSRVAGPRPSAL